MTLIEPIYVVQWLDPLDNGVLYVAFETLERAQEFVARREPKSVVTWEYYDDLLIPTCREDRPRGRRRRCWSWEHYIINTVAFEHTVSPSSPTSSVSNDR